MTKQRAAKPTTTATNKPVARAANKPEIGVVPLMGCRCRCGHEWLPRDKDDRPRVCPKCKSANWDRPKKFERK
jgi:predicted Zn-ribbon and HTH transcriptional regulator